MRSKHSLSHKLGLNMHAKKGDGQKQQQQTAPWQPQQRFIQEGFNRADNLYKDSDIANQNASQYQGDIKSQYQSIIDQFSGGNQLAADGLSYGQSVLNGDFLNSNPYVDQMFNNASDSVMNRVNANFSSGGRSGSPAHMGTVTEELGDLATNIYGNNYAQERQFQNSMLGNLPMLNQLQTADQDSLINAYQGLQGNELASSDRDWANLQNYMNAISGNYGSQSSGKVTETAGDLTKAGNVLGIGKSLFGLGK